MHTIVQSLVLTMLLSSAANAALFGRLPMTPNGMDYQAYYDDVLNITWLANANAGGDQSWNDANAWAAGLDVDGITGWRLPSMDVNGDHMATGDADNGIIDCSTSGELACRDNELGYMYYYNLAGSGNLSGNQDPFTNIQFGHWSGTEFASIPGNAWLFALGFGGQFGSGNGALNGAWAVRSGDVALVPLPAGIWLLGSGLLGLAGLRRKA